jgi:glucosamine--fructose-6-phosphate aminotransferase (isomerizing)
LLTVYGRRLRFERPFVLAISQSGAGRDVNAVVGQIGDMGGRSLALTNEPDSALAEQASFCLPLCAGPERAVVATKTFIATLGAVTQLVAALSEDRALTDAVTELPAALAETARHAKAWWNPEAFSRLGPPMFVIGRGVGFAIACELALKLKEACRIHAEAYSAAEFKHGPIAVVNAECPVLVLCLDDETREGVLALVRDLDGMNAPVILVGPQLPALTECSRVHCLSTPKTATVFTDAIVAVFQMYDAIERLSAARGIDSDQPPHLNKVTSTF